MLMVVGSRPDLLPGFESEESRLVTGSLVAGSVGDGCGEEGGKTDRWQRLREGCCGCGCCVEKGRPIYD